MRWLLLICLGLRQINSKYCNSSSCCGFVVHFNTCWQSSAPVSCPEYSLAMPKLCSAELGLEFHLGNLLGLAPEVGMGTESCCWGMGQDPRSATPVGWDRTPDLQLLWGETGSQLTNFPGKRKDLTSPIPLGWDRIPASQFPWDKEGSQLLNSSGKRKDLS